MSSQWKPPGMCTIIVTTLPAVCNSRRSSLRNTVTSPLSCEGSPEHCYVTLHPQTTTNTRMKQIINSHFAYPVPNRYGQVFEAEHFWNAVSPNFTINLVVHSTWPEVLPSANLSNYLLIYLYYDCWRFCLCAMFKYSYFIWTDFWLFFGMRNADGGGGGWWCPLVSYMQKRCCDEA